MKEEHTKEVEDNGTKTALSHFNNHLLKMYQNKEWFNSKEIKNKIFNLLLDYSNGSLFIHHIIPFITKNDLFLNFYLTCKKIAILIQQQITYNVILNLNEDNLLSVTNIYLQDNNKPLIVKEFIENGLSTGTKKSWDFLEGKRLDFCKTFPSILHFVNGLKIDAYLISEIDYYGQSRLTFNDFRDFIIQFYKYTFLLNHKSNVKYFIFNQSTGYYDQERNLERFKLLFIEDLANLFKNNDCNKQPQQLLSFKYIQGITQSYGYFGYSPILNGEQLAQIIIDFQKITSLQNLTVTSCWGEYLNKFVDEMAKICDKNIFNNLKKLKLNCGDTFDENSFYNFLEKLNETKVVIKSEDFTLLNDCVATAYKMLTKSNIYFSGNLKIYYAHHNTEDYVQKFDIVKFLESLQRSYKLFSLKIADCELYTTTNQLEKLFNFKNLTTFECINTTIKKYNDDGTETILTKEFLNNFKFQKLKLIKLEKLNLNEIPNSLNNLNLNQLSLANNKIENINNLNLQNNLFIDIQNNNIKDISILNNYRYINLLNNPILQNKNIGFYNNNYFLIDSKEITFKKYFQNNLMELYLFNYMQFVKVLKKKNSKNSKIPILSNSKAFLQLLNLSKFNDQLKDTFYETALNNLKLFKFYLNILYTEPEENPYSIKGIGAVVQVAIQNCENNNNWLIISLNCNLKNDGGDGFIVEEICVWNECDYSLEKINYILQNWKQMIIKK